jgi:hypothetical protein
MTVVERIARVLAGQHISRNAEGTEASAGDLVDARWHDYLDDAIAVLKTMREPDEAMLAAGAQAPTGDLEKAWDRMIRAALGEHEATA